MTTKGAVQTSNERQLFLLRLSDALRPLADPLAVQVEAARILGEYLHANRVGYAEVQEDNVTMGGDTAIYQCRACHRGPLSL